MDNFNFITSYLELYTKTMIPFIENLLGFWCITLVMLPVILFGVGFVIVSNYLRVFFQKYTLLLIFPNLTDKVEKINKISLKFMLYYFLLIFLFSILIDVVLLLLYKK